MHWTCHCPASSLVSHHQSYFKNLYTLSNMTVKGFVSLWLWDRKSSFTPKGEDEWCGRMGGHIRSVEMYSHQSIRYNHEEREHLFGHTSASFYLSTSHLIRTLDTVFQIEIWRLLFRSSRHRASCPPRREQTLIQPRLTTWFHHGNWTPPSSGGARCANAVTSHGQQAHFRCEA